MDTIQNTGTKEAPMNKYRVYLTNVGYYLDAEHRVPTSNQAGEFASLEVAVAAGKKAGFDFSVLRHDGELCFAGEGHNRQLWTMVAAWSAIGGLTHYEAV
jgi:hypothetical protein